MAHHFTEHLSFKVHDLVASRTTVWLFASTIFKATHIRWIAIKCDLLDFLVRAVWRITSSRFQIWAKSSAARFIPANRYLPSLDVRMFYLLTKPIIFNVMPLVRYTLYVIWWCRNVLMGLKQQPIRIMVDTRFRFTQIHHTNALVNVSPSSGDGSSHHWGWAFTSFLFPSMYAQINNSNILWPWFKMRMWDKEPLK